MRDGDIELYSCDIDGLNVKRLTFEPGYDGGAFYSADSKKLSLEHPDQRGSIKSI